MLKLNYSNPKCHVLGAEDAYTHQYSIAGDAFTGVTCGRDEETKNTKKETHYCDKLTICPDHTRRRIKIKFRMWVGIRETVLSFKFRENQLRVFGDPEGRKSPFPIAFAGRYIQQMVLYRTNREVSVTAAIEGYVTVTLMTSDKQSNGRRIEVE